MQSQIMHTRLALHHIHILAIAHGQLLQSHMQGFIPCKCSCIRIAIKCATLIERDRRDLTATDWSCDESWMHGEPLVSDDVTREMPGRELKSREFARLRVEIVVVGHCKMWIERELSLSG